MDESIWLKLKHKLLDYYITLADIGTEFGLDGSPFYIDQNLSTKLTNLFKDTKITVYVIQSKYPGCHTHPGTKYLSHPWILKFKSIPDIKGAYILTLIDNILSYAECIEGIITGTIRLKNNRSDKLIYDPTTNKFEVGFSESTIYIHSANYDFLNEKELISICVMLIGTECYAIFHNVLRLFKTSNNIISFGFGINLFMEMYNVLSNQKTFSDSLGDVFKLACALGLGALIIKILIQYPKEREKLFLDEFPIKMDLGEAYKSANEKMLKYELQLKSNPSLMVKRLNFIDKILLLYKRLCNIKDIYLTKIGIGNRIESKVWVDLIEKRLDRYNKDYKDSHQIDRSDHITTEVPYISPIVKYSDKIYKYITGE